MNGTMFEQVTSRRLNDHKFIHQTQSRLEFGCSQHKIKHSQVQSISQYKKFLRRAGSVLFVSKVRAMSQQEF